MLKSGSLSCSCHQFDRTHVVCGCGGISTQGCYCWSRHPLCVFLCSDAMVCWLLLKWSLLLPHLRDQIIGPVSNRSPSAKTDTNTDMNPTCYLLKKKNMCFFWLSFKIRLLAYLIIFIYYNYL